VSVTRRNSDWWILVDMSRICLVYVSRLCLVYVSCMCLVYVLYKYVSGIHMCLVYVLCTYVSRIHCTVAPTLLMALHYRIAEFSWTRRLVNELRLVDNTLQHTATHCNTLQHTATHCNTNYVS